MNELNVLYNELYGWVDLPSFGLGFALALLVFLEVWFILDVAPAVISCVKSFVLKMIDLIPSMKKQDH